MTHVILYVILDDFHQSRTKHMCKSYQNHGRGHIDETIIDINIRLCMAFIVGTRLANIMVVVVGTVLQVIMLCTKTAAWLHAWDWLLV